MAWAMANVQQRHQQQQQQQQGGGGGGSLPPGAAIIIIPGVSELMAGLAQQATDKIAGMGLGFTADLLW